MTFRALLLEKTGEGFRCVLKDLPDDALPDGDVLVEIQYSTLNYKDGLAICDKAPVVRNWPMVPGIDGAGTVIESRHPAWSVGDPVILNGWGVGETHWGCLAERANLKGDWLIRRPDGLSVSDAMAIGTAGYTAMLCVMALEGHGVGPGDGPVLVTGATGGVGSVAISLLAARGYEVTASTGRTAEEDYFRDIGAAQVIDRAALGAPGKPLQQEMWSAVIDPVGSVTLANALAQTCYGGIVAACGLAQGADLPASVMPFILRGVTLAGIDNVMAPLPLRQQAWGRLATEIRTDQLALISSQVDLNDVIEGAGRLMRGEVRGRLVVAI